MRHLPPAAAALLVGAFIGALSFGACAAVIMTVGSATGSGLLGHHGPYGPASGLLISLFIASFPSSLAAAIYAGIRAYQMVAHLRASTGSGEAAASVSTVVPSKPVLSMLLLLPIVTILIAIALTR